MLRSATHSAPHPCHLRFARFAPIAVVLLVAAVPFLFRGFATVDGPRHALHALILEASLTGHRFVADGMTYDSSSLPAYWSQLPMMLMMRYLPVELADRSLAFLSAAFVGLSLLALTRSSTDRLSPSMLWAIPILFSYLLIMGFHHFHFGVGLCFLAVAWYFRRKEPLARWSGVMVAAFLACASHRAALPLMAGLLAVSVMVDEVSRPYSTSHTARMRRTITALACSALLVAFVIWLNTTLDEVRASGEWQPIELRDFPLARPLLLLDLSLERVPLLILCTLLACAVVCGLAVRWKLGPRVIQSDSLLIMAAACMLASLLLTSERAQALYLSERCQWIGLLILVPWLCTMHARASSTLRSTMALFSLMMMPVQLIRWGNAEMTLSGLADQHALIEEVAAQLEPNGVVLVGGAEKNWLLQHAPAMLAMAYDGVLLPGPPIRARAFAPMGPRRVQYRFWELASEPSALPAHWGERQQPMIDQVLLLGPDRSLRARWLRHWQPVLESHYLKTFDNGYASVWTAKADT